MTMKSSMTSKEQVEAVFAGEIPDRVPYKYSYLRPFPLVSRNRGQSIISIPSFLSLSNLIGGCPY